MNCTAFGLIVAIIGLIGFAVLNGKTQALEDDINEASRPGAQPRRREPPEGQPRRRAGLTGLSSCQRLRFVGNRRIERGAPQAARGLDLLANHGDDPWVA